MSGLTRPGIRKGTQEKFEGLRGGVRAKPPADCCWRPPAAVRALLLKVCTAVPIFHSETYGPY